MHEYVETKKDRNNQAGVRKARYNCNYFSLRCCDVKYLRLNPKPELQSVYQYPV